MVQALDAAHAQDIARAQHPTGRLSAVPAELLDGQDRHKLRRAWLGGEGLAGPSICRKGQQSHRVVASVVVFTVRGLKAHINQVLDQLAEISSTVTLSVPVTSAKPSLKLGFLVH
jgi:hypothetical protein